MPEPLMVPNAFDLSIYSDYQANARDLRWTWAWDYWTGGFHEPEYRPGPVVLSNPKLEYPFDGKDPKKLAALDSAASIDDVKAWAYAARWNLQIAWDEYETAVKKANTAGTVAKERRNPDRPNFRPDRINPLNKRPLGGYDIILGEPWIATSSWPNYFASLVLQIVGKAIQGKVTTLIQIQIAMKGVQLLMFELYQDPPGSEFSGQTPEIYGVLTLLEKS